MPIVLGMVPFSWLPDKFLPAAQRLRPKCSSDWTMGSAHKYVTLYKLPMVFGMLPLSLFRAKALPSVAGVATAHACC